jgi:hypothetical protein
MQRHVTFQCAATRPAPVTNRFRPALRSVQASSAAATRSLSSMAAACAASGQASRKMPQNWYVRVPLVALYSIVLTACTFARDGPQCCVCGFAVHMDRTRRVEPSRPQRTLCRRGLVRPHWPRIRAFSALLALRSAACAARPVDQARGMPCSTIYACRPRCHVVPRAAAECVILCRSPALLARC